MLNRKMTTALAFMVCIIASAAHGAEQTMTTIANDRDSALNILKAMVDDQGVLQGLNYVTVNNESAPPVQANKRFSLAQLASVKGVVLDGDSSHDVFILQGRVDAHQGGDLTYRYLTNGMNGTYAECKIGLRRSPQGKWHILNLSSKQPAAKAFIKTWALGISEVEGLCPKP